MEKAKKTDVAVFAYFISVMLILEESATTLTRSFMWSVHVGYLRSESKFSVLKMLVLS